MYAILTETGPACPGAQATVASAMAATFPDGTPRYKTVNVQQFEGEITKLFNMIDINGDGGLDKSEL